MLYTFVIDLKLTPDNKVKILEIGQPFQSGAVGYEQAYKQCIMHDVIMPFYEEELKVPAFSLDPRAKERRELGAGHGFSLLDWQDSRGLYEKASQLPQKPGFDKDTTSTYSAIVSPFYLEGYYSAHLRAPQKEGIAVVNDNRIFVGAAHSKFLENRFFTPHLGDLAPQETAVKIETPEQMAAIIKAAVTSDKIVLKLPEAARAEGVIITDRDKLEETLTFLVSKPDEAAPPQPGQSIASYFNHKAWRRSEWAAKDVIVAQSFEQSTPVVNDNDGKTYAPTMRAFVSLWKEEGEVKCKMHGCYWKFPTEPMTEDASAKNMISASPTKMAGGKVSQAHSDIVTAQLESRLPLIIKQLDETKMADVIRDCIRNPDDIRLMAIRRHSIITRDTVMFDGLTRDEIKAFAELLAGYDVSAGEFIPYETKTGRPVLLLAGAEATDDIRHLEACYADRVLQLRQKAAPAPAASGFNEP